MISVDDARRTTEFDEHYVIHPVKADWTAHHDWKGTPVPDGFSYNSASNERWLTVDDLRGLVADSVG